MNENYYSINEIIKWYDKYVNLNISDDFLIDLINKGIIKPKEKCLYSLDDVNSFLLETYENNFIVDDNGKFKIKENRIQLIKKYKNNKHNEPKKFKITSLNGNKLKLIKLN